MFFSFADFALVLLKVTFLAFLCMKSAFVLIVTFVLRLYLFNPPFLFFPFFFPPIWSRLLEVVVTHSSNHSQRTPLRVCNDMSSENCAFLCTIRDWNSLCHIKPRLVTAVIQEYAFWQREMYNLRDQSVLFVFNYPPVGNNNCSFT